MLYVLLFAPWPAAQIESLYGHSLSASTPSAIPCGYIGALEAIKSEDWHVAAATQDKLFGLEGWWYACGDEGTAGGHMVHISQEPNHNSMTARIYPTSALHSRLPGK